MPPNVRARVVHLAAAVLLALVACAPQSGQAVLLSSASAAVPGAARPLAAPVAVVRVGRARQRIPDAFSGLSFELNELAGYEREGVLFDRVISLIRRQDGQPVLLRIGGRSADDAYWKTPTGNAPSWVFELGDPWLSRLANLVARDRLQVMVDLNLAVHSPAMAAAFARTLARALPSGSIAALAVGNEPELYRYQPGLERERIATTLPSTPPHWIDGYSPADYARDYRAYADALSEAAPGVPLAAPEMTVFDRAWASPLSDRRLPIARIIAIHRYASSTCWPRNSPYFPSIPWLLGPRSTTGLASSLNGAVAFARPRGLTVRISELGSASCGGVPGVSDSFATALWAPDAMFALIRAGVAAVNWHIRPALASAPFELTPHGLAVRPELYGLALFARMMAPGAELMTLRVVRPRLLPLSAWAVSPRAGLNLLLVNRGPRTAAVRVQAREPGPAALTRLLAPAITSRHGVTLGGRWIGPDARWHGPQLTATIARRRGTYHLKLRGYSAALMTMGQS